MPIRQRPPSSWPAILAALALFVVGTGAIALHRGWISPKTWRSAQRILLSIRSELAGRNEASDADGAAPEGDGFTDDRGPVEGELGRADEVPADLAAPADINASEPAPGWSRSKSGTSPDRSGFAPRQRATADIDPFEERRRRLRERHSGDLIAALAEEDASAGNEEPSDEPILERPAGRKPVPAAPGASREKSDPSPVPPASPSRGKNSPPVAPVSSGEDSLLDLPGIEQLIEGERDVQALQELTKWYWKTPAKREELRPRMEELSQRIYFSQQPHYFEPHIVANSEQLRTIAKEYQLTWEYLARLNRTDPRRIRPGQRLKVVPGPFHVLVNVRSHELIVHNNGCFVKRYVIGAGKDRSTPVGVFPVKNKLVNPTYYPPEGGIVKADDPANPLGSRWIDIGDSYGIHGTNEPDTVGKDLSRGCVRMRNEEVAEVYDFLIVGSEVRIQR